MFELFLEELDPRQARFVFPGGSEPRLVGQSIYRLGPRISHRKIECTVSDLHGTHDESVPVAQAQEFYDKLKAAAVPVSLTKIDEGPIFLIQKPESRRQLALESRDFFNQYLGSAR